MREYKKVVQIDNMLKEMKRDQRSEEQELDLLDSLSDFLDLSNFSANENIISMAERALWENIYNETMNKVRAVSLISLTDYEPLSAKKKNEIIYNLRYSKQVMIIMIVLKYRLLDVMRKVQEGVPHEKAFPANVLAEITESNMTPREFLNTIIDTTLELRDLVITAVDISKEELEEILASCDSNITKVMLITHISDISESDLREFAIKGSITHEDVVGAIRRL